MGQGADIERVIGSLIGTPENYLNHRVSLVAELGARYAVALEIIDIPITEQTFDENLPQLLELTGQISSDLYRLTEIARRVPTYHMFNGGEPNNVLDLNEFKRVSAAATIIFCWKLLCLFEDGFSSEPDLPLAERSDFTVHLALESERVYRNMLLAIDSRRELDLVAKLDARHESDVNKGKAKAENYGPIRADLFECASKWWAICVHISRRDIAIEFEKQIEPDKYDTVAGVEAMAEWLELHPDFKPRGKNGGRPRKEHTIKYLNSQKPPL